MEQKKLSFSDQDSEKLVSLLNFVANHAEFNRLNIKKMLEFTKLLNWAQVELLPKINAHKFEILGVRQAVPEAAEKPSKKK